MDIVTSARMFRGMSWWSVLERLRVRNLVQTVTVDARMVTFASLGSFRIASYCLFRDSFDIRFDSLH